VSRAQVSTRRCEETSTAGITFFLLVQVQCSNTIRVLYSNSTCSAGTNSQLTHTAQYGTPCLRRKLFPLLLQPLICHDRGPCEIITPHSNALDKVLPSREKNFLPFFFFPFLLFSFDFLPIECRLTCLPYITWASIAGETSLQLSRPAVSKGKQNNSPTPHLRVPYPPPINHASTAKSSTKSHTAYEAAENGGDI